MNKKALMKILLGTAIVSTLTGGTIYYNSAKQNETLESQGVLSKVDEQDKTSSENINKQDTKESDSNTSQTTENKILLKENDNGDAVSTLQKKLYNIGYDISVDGNLGPKTVDVVKQFQAKSNIEQTGIYDSKTEELLSKVDNIRDYDILKSDEEKKAKEYAEAQEKSPLADRIKSYLGNSINNVGFVYYDLTSGEKIAFNENKICTAASTYKVGMNMVAYDKVRNGSLSLTEGLTYSDNFYESGTGILQGQINSTLQSPVPVQKLLDLAIKYSDNIATNMVSNRLDGGQAVRQAVCDMTGIQIETGNNRITSEMEFRLLKKLYENRNDKYYSHLISVMKQTEFHDRIDKYVPQDIVAHKIGNYGSYTNDVGIVFTDKPYIFVMYVDGASNASEKIAKVSKMVYDSQINK